MSEDTALASKNLCTTEDAFEQFQTDSMYEEEQYITLSDIVPQQSKPPDIKDLIELPFENEILLGSKKEVNMDVSVNTEGIKSVQQTVSSTSLESIINMPNEDRFPEQDLNNSEINNASINICNLDISSNQNNSIKTNDGGPFNNSRGGRRRGRKPKTDTNNPEILDKSITPFSSDPENTEISPSTGQRKRGRPRKKSLLPDGTPELTKPKRSRPGRPRKSSIELNIENGAQPDDRTLNPNNDGSITSQFEAIKNDTPKNNYETLKNTITDKLQENKSDPGTTPMGGKRKRNSPKTLGNADLNITTKSNYQDTISKELTPNNDVDDISLSQLKNVPDIPCNAANENLTTEGNNDSDLMDTSLNIDNTETKTKKKGKKGRPKKVGKNTSTDTRVTVPTTIDDDETDDLCLSTLKKLQGEERIDTTVDINSAQTETVDNQENDLSSTAASNAIGQDLNTENNLEKPPIETTPTKRNTKMPLMSDFEYNIDSVINNELSLNGDNSLLVEDTSKRPIRRKVSKRYEEESDEDPFANIELSDDEPKRRKGNRYYSDDEYVPGRKDSIKSVESTDSDINDEDYIDEIKTQRRRNKKKKSESTSPRKKSKKDVECTTTSDTNLATSVGQADRDNSNSSIAKSDTSQSKRTVNSWGGTNEFENFLAKKMEGTNLKIKKVSSTKSSDNQLTPLEIPVINPEEKRTVQKSCQTNEVNTVSTAVQTSSPFEVNMKETVSLTPEQSKKACFFLEGIVKTTAELGQLMTQKSQDFIKKKINTTHVTDTMKMDYCVKKSFLLFKLAKHNLMQMEEDLAKQYEEFLQTNNLSSCREEPKKVVAKPKESNSDSDCEIVDEQPPAMSSKRQEKPKFNPRTVFLNKELSIKIAKKPSEPAAQPKKKIDIKGRHTVWINDTVMVKKVAPTQSFLAQDSRNKKPPDTIVTTKMVSDFFKEYNRQKALSVCAPFVTSDWLNVGIKCACHYFVVEPIQFNTNTNMSPNTSVPETNNNYNVVKPTMNNLVLSSPDTLFKICFQFVKKHLHDLKQVKKVVNQIKDECTEERHMPMTLLQLSLNKSLNIFKENEAVMVCNYDKIENVKITVPTTVQLLKTLCHRRIVDLLFDSSQETTSQELQKTYKNGHKHEEGSNVWDTHSLENLCTLTDTNSDCSNDFDTYSLKNIYPPISRNGLSKNELVTRSLQTNYSPVGLNQIKSLLTICVEFIQKTQYETHKINVVLPKTLKHLTIDKINKLIHGQVQNQISDGIIIEGLTINSVNTLSEEAFLNLHHTNLPESHGYLNYSDNDDHDYEENYDDTEENNPDEQSWISHVQMQEPISCFSLANSEVNQETVNEINDSLNMPIITRIKLEPLDDNIEQIELPQVRIKSEPTPGLDEMTIIPNLKAEITDYIPTGPLQRQGTNSYDIDAFENFVATNKMIHALAHDDDEDMYSQSGQRIRRQHEPDYVEGYDPNLSLLLPQTYEPFSIENAKGRLMESSSDEDNKNKKTTTKKKTDKRKKKKPDPKLSKEPVPSPSKNNKELVPSQTKANKEPPPSSPKNVKEPTLSTKMKRQHIEVTTLTRKMKERIRQEETKDAKDSSDSDSETIPLLRSRKKVDSEEADKVGNKEKLKPKDAQIKDTEIQCNNVDSTAQNDDDVVSFNGFTAIDQNEISSYHKYMKYIYNKIIPEKEKSLNEIDDKTAKANSLQKDQFAPEAPVINPEEQVELLECEPTMPIFEDNDEKPVKRQKPRIGPKCKCPRPDNVTPKELPYTDRHGWHCFPLNTNDTKLYQDALILLEKLPETFVQTYFEYQEIGIKDRTDIEIDRLTNLSTLSKSNQISDGKSNRKKNDANIDGGVTISQSSSQPNSPMDNDDNFAKSNRKKNDAKVDGGEEISQTSSRPDSPMDNDDHFAELAPSDEEGASVDNELPLSVLQKQAENSFAKNLLMNDNDSDSDSTVSKVKEEPVETTDDSIKLRSKGKHSKKKALEPPTNPEDLVLTADMSMKTELTLLHAPVVMKEVSIPVSKGPTTRNKDGRQSKQPSSSIKMKNEEDSSSEEEKQWVNTKEKLLKRLGKKEDASADDAKRAKLVSEFIERRGGQPGVRKRSFGPRARRSAKKFLEREKQLRVLSRELFGEQSSDPTTKRSAAYFKGRRNIRKVIDKKSLTLNTIIAGMEEAERKKRLHMRQTRLRELLNCEENENVVVINDEVCLEYDFEENRPVVTIHPFFTKVMKMHQYIGVKFMWDACFESLTSIESGHPGGGCILAHCMGLGKTLQVLALLHTVLTHPRMGMQRVLVCCPLSTVLNWVDEIHKWIGPVTNKIKVFELSKLKKTNQRAYQLEDWYNGGGILIIGYELFRNLSTIDPDDVRPKIFNKIRTALLDPGPDIIVCDEGHLLKNDSTVLAVAMSRVVTKRRIVLTGTPMQNNLREYYCMVNFVKPNLLGTYAEYSNRFENPIMNGQHRDSQEEDIKLMKTRTHILHKILEGCLQRQEASVLYPYLPKKHEYTVFIPLTQCQWDLYKHYLSNYANKCKNSVLKDFHILQKIWSHPQVLHNFQTNVKDKIKAEKPEDDLATEDQEEIKPNATELWWLEYMDGGNIMDALESSNKFVVVFRILAESVALGDKVLIFSTSLFCLDALEYFLKKINNWSLGHEYYRLDGSVPVEVRQKWCREFNADNNLDTKLFLVSTRAGCLGLNMTAANRVIILDTSWNPAHDIQSIFRVYRFGQKKDCYIYRLVAMGTMEQKMYERSVTKQAVACRVVDEQLIDRHYNMAELTELYKFDEAGASVAGGVAVGVSDVVLLRVAREAALHAVHEHDSLLRGSSEQDLPEHERNAAWQQFEQEQAHKQFENKLVTNIPKLKLKRIEGQQDYSSTYQTPTFDAFDAKPETSEDKTKLKKGRPRKSRNEVGQNMNDTPNNEEFITDDQISAVYFENKQDLAEPVKNKRGRPRKSTITDETPSTSRVQTLGNTFPDLDDPISKNQEEIMVEQIAEILLKYNFHNKKDITEVSNLVTTVTNIVKKGYIEEGTDDLTASVARILLMKRMSIPVLNDIMSESINNTIRVPSTANEDCSNDTQRAENISAKGTKRRAALVAAKSIDIFSKSDDVINIDDDDHFDNMDTEFVPAADDTNSTATKYRNKIRMKLNRNSKRTEVVVSPPPEDILSDVNNVDSDTDTSSETDTSKRSQNKASKSLKDTDVEQPSSTSQRKTAKKTNQKNDKPEAVVLSSDDEPLETRSPSRNIQTTEKTVETPVPLPMSILSNDNFINIVAHTYLEGNPMLDEDAAMLAARYSVQKVLNETNQTGKPIYNGAIYDIAMKVLGKDILQKMHTHQNTSQDTANKQISQQMDTLISNKNTSSPQNREQSRETDTSVNKEPHLVQCAKPKAGGVVPVGLIKSVRCGPSKESLGEAPEECILPDDDVTVSSPAPASTGSSTSGRGHRRPGPKSSKLTRPPAAPVALTATAPAASASPAPAPSPPQSIATICLDSDEEDTPPPPAPPSSKSKRSVQPLVLKQVLMPGDSQPKFVLLPAPKEVAMKKVKIIPYSKTVPTSTPKHVPTSTPKPVPTSTPKPVPTPTLDSAPMSTPAPIPAHKAVPAVSSTRTRGSRPAPSPSAEQATPVRVATRCKPGDIFRISNTGAIEVINLDDVSKSSASEPGFIDLTSFDEAPTVEPGTSKTIASKANASKSSASRLSKQKTSKPKSSSKGRTNVDSNSSEDCPLSILKDVVHIQASDDESDDRRRRSLLVKTDSSKHSNISVQHVVSSDLKKPSTSKPSTASALSSLPSEIIKQIQSSKGKSFVETDKHTKQDLLNRIKPLLNKIQTKPTEKATSSLNLKTLNPETSKILNKVGQELIVNKATKSQPLKDSKTSSSKKSTAIEISTSKLKDKKRPSTSVETTAPKRRKSKPMTLMDFDIDDIDDIIEFK